MQDIWEDKFIDLELLIDKKEDLASPMVLKSIQTDDMGEIVQLVKPKPPKGITNIDQWAHAFNVYMSMYTRKFVHETHNLLTYSTKIKELAAKGGGTSSDTMRSLENPDQDTAPPGKYPIWNCGLTVTRPG